MDFFFEKKNSNSPDFKNQKNLKLLDFYNRFQQIAKI